MSVYYITCNQLPLISMFLFATSVCTLYVHVCIRYSIIETKEAARIGYNRFLFPHEYSGEGRGALYPIRAASFVSIVLYPIRVLIYQGVLNFFLCVYIPR